jgi:4-aminobutyrate aminotransferase-like enzyme
MNAAELVARRERVFGMGAEFFYDEPVHLVRGEGVYLYDADGARYHDLYNNVPCVGHCHPHVVCVWCAAEVASAILLPHTDELLAMFAILGILLQGQTPFL